MTYGITATGFNKKPLEAIKASIRQRQRDSTVLGPTFDNEDNTAIGQANGTVSSELSEAWEELEEVYHSYDPDAAEDAALENVAAITGTKKRDASPSEVVLTLSLNAGALVPAGAIVSRSDRDDIRFETTVEVENVGVSAATFTVIATCLVTGPVPAPAGTLTVIVTPFSGWTAVNNVADAEEGRNVDGNIQLRQRRQDQLALRGGSTVDAIRADILDFDTHPEFAAIEYCNVFENPGDSTDPVTGLPPHSLEVLIDDGAVPSVDNSELAQAIWDTKPGGIQTYGSESGTAYDGTGKAQLVKMTRVTRANIYIEVQIEINEAYPSDGDDLVKQAIVDECHERFLAGSEVIVNVVRAAAINAAGVTDAPTVYISRTVSPSSEANIEMALRERPIFDVDNIEVVIL